MTQGRKSAALPEPHPEVVDAAALSRKGNALAEMSQRSADVSQRFGDGLPYERSRIVNQARFFMGQSAEAMLELGKCLIQLKENEPHGEFAEIVNERLGISTRSAQLMMQAATKYLSPTLVANAKSISLLGKSKLFDLMTESDDDIVELAEGGTLAGATLDEMASMTRRELQAALADSKKVADAKDKVIAKKDKRLAEIAEADELRRASPTSSQLQAMRDATLATEQALDVLLVEIDAVLAAPASPAIELAARHTLDYICQHLAAAAQARGLALNLEELAEPLLHLQDVHAAAQAGTGRGKKQR